jgi:DNA-binding PadR family transcriptional regulator
MVRVEHRPYRPRPGGGAAYGALQVLERHGLIWDRGATPGPPPHPMQHEYEISPYGDYLIDRLAESA